jgi:integrase
MLISQIEPMHVRAFARAVSEKGLSPSSVRLALAPVKAALADAAEDGVIRSSPATSVRVPRPRLLSDDQKERAKALSSDEIATLLDKTADEWRPFVGFIAQTGVRIGEAVALEWGDLDFGRQRVSIRRRLYRGQLDTPKSKYGRRVIPLTSEMTLVLWELRKAADDGTDRALVWVTRVGTPHNPANLTTRVLKPAAKAAGLWPMGWHVLRHSWASELFRRGLNPKARHGSATTASRSPSTPTCI